MKTALDGSTAGGVTSVPVLPTKIALGNGLAIVQLTLTPSFVTAAAAAADVPPGVYVYVCVCVCVCACVCESVCGTQKIEIHANFKNTPFLSKFCPNIPSTNSQNFKSPKFSLTKKEKKFNSLPVRRGVVFALISVDLILKHGTDAQNLKIRNGRLFSVRF